MRLRPHRLLLPALVVLLAGCGSAPGQQTTTLASATPAGEQATVEYVNDGDTLRTTSGRRVRLVQIDAPELHTDCYGKAALAALRRLAPPGTRVTLLADPALDRTDRYGRILRYVFVGGTNVNVALVQAGAASPYFYRGERGRYARRLEQAVDGARAARRGYWGSCPGARLNTGIGSITGAA